MLAFIINNMSAIRYFKERPSKSAIILSETENIRINENQRMIFIVCDVRSNYLFILI